MVRHGYKHTMATTSKSNNIGRTSLDDVGGRGNNKCFDNNSAPQILLEETFYILSKKNTVFKVRLTNYGLCLIKESNGTTKEQTINISDIIGCRCMRSKRPVGAGSCSCQSLARPPPLRVVDENSGERDESDTSAYLYIYAYVLKRSRRGTKRERTTITLRFRSFDKYEDNNREAQRWRNAVKSMLKRKHDRKVLVLVNPKSGAGKAREIFQQRVAQIFNESEVQYELHVTKHANYAREFIRERDLSQWSGVVVMGGDGILFEVINGLLERHDWEKVLRDMPLGIIPSGSGNGLAKTISHFYDEPYSPNPVLGAALAIVKGRYAPMDLVRVETTKQIVFSFLSIGWGLLSDIDIESERLRAIGGQRFTVWSVARLIGLRTYHGKLWYLPMGLRRSVSANVTTDYDWNDMEPLGRNRVDSWYSATSRRSAYYSTTASSYRSADENTKPPIRTFGPASQLPALTAPVPSNWICIDGPFVFVHAAYQSHISSDVIFAPRSRLDDGVIWLCVMRAGASRAQILSFLLGLSSGNHASTPERGVCPVMMLPVQAFRIEPKNDTHGYITVDGEQVDYGPLQAEVCPGIASIMVP